MRTIELDGSAFDDLDGFHDEVERKLTKGLDWRPAHNLNAFNDLLYGGFGVHEYYESVQLIWRDSARSRKVLGWPATEAYLSSKLKTCHPQNRPEVKEDLAAARRREGQTLYELICKIIREHDCITFEEA